MPNLDDKFIAPIRPSTTKYVHYDWFALTARGDLFGHKLSQGAVHFLGNVWILADQKQGTIPFVGMLAGEFLYPHPGGGHTHNITILALLENGDLIGYDHDQHQWLALGNLVQLAGEQIHRL